MGLNLLVRHERTLKDHPDWDFTRFSGDRKLWDYIRSHWEWRAASDGPNEEDEARGVLVYHDAKLSRAWAEGRQCERRMGELLALLAANPKYGASVSI